uniref:ribosomal protein S18-alanine N-acetyltransferase n=1 Tax=uncultured Allobacillus sp. TaxID=1638025 RepID=UPI002597A4CC|nr:ribosomal protein S18-alanine N-acetyltransferase [uncultured Allobacillus sp.]
MNEISKDVIVRRMTYADLDQVMEVENASFRSPWKEEDITHDLINNPFSDYLVMEKGDQIIGYVGTWTVVEAAQITNIAIHPDERGQGYSVRLFQRMLKYLRLKGATELTLEVRKSNHVAQRLYERFGMKPVGVRKNYYQDDGEDAIVMWVEL